MKDQGLAFVNRLWKGFLSFTPGQKAVTIAATLLITIGGYFFSSWASKPTYAPLFTNLSSTDAAAIVDKLNSSKTPYQLANGGTEIMVPQKDVYTVRLSMSSQGLPTSGGTGYSLLDKEGITTSDFKQHVDYQRALEGELATTIKSISGVSSASVHLAIPEQTVFDDGTKKPTAAVLIGTTPGTTLSAGQVQSVINLVASSVAGMTAQQVTVTDATGKLLASPGDDNSAAAADTRTQQTQAFENQQQAAAQLLLDQMVGKGHSVVTVNADLNFDKSNTTTQKVLWAPGAPPVSSSKTSETWSGNGSGTGGTLGAGSPAPTPATSSTAGNGNYSKTSETVNNAVGQETSTSVAAPGKVRTLSVAVLVDKNVANVDITAVRDLVSRAVGLDTTRGDSIAVQTSAFDTSVAAQAQKAQDAAAAAAAKDKKQAQMVSLVKTGVVVLLIVGIIVGSLIGSRRRKAAVVADEPTPDELDAFLEALSTNESSLPPAPIELPAKSRPAQLIEAHQQRLTEMADEDPAAVARLLRGWLNAKDS